jgi:hypothetical protein
MPTTPTVEDVARICGLADPVIRNLQITQCYHELSEAFARRTGASANWCTFAAWASKQAGQTIRKEDLVRLLERRLRGSPSAIAASETVAAAARPAGESQLLGQQALSLNAPAFTPAVERASDAVARGNRKVFEEIGHEFACFFQAGLHGPDPNAVEANAVQPNAVEPEVLKMNVVELNAVQPNAVEPEALKMNVVELQALERWIEALRPGDPPDGQEYLRRAFRHYVLALGEADTKARAELLLLANIEIGFHEQTRLQPEIAESMDAGLVSFTEFARALLGALFPRTSLLRIAYLYLRRALGRPTALDLAMQALLAEVRLQLRLLITEIMMTISLPSGDLRLGDALSADYPESLRELSHPELCRFLEERGLPAGGLEGSGALDWADLPDRLHFILALFRCYQEHAPLFEPPFTPEQAADLKAGRLPGGRL